MGAVQDSIRDRVGYRWVADVVVPFVDGNLASDQSGARSITVLDDLEEIAPVLVAERGNAPVIQNQQIESGEPG